MGAVNSLLTVGSVDRGAYIGPLPEVLLPRDLLKPDTPAEHLWHRPVLRASDVARSKILVRQPVRRTGREAASATGALNDTGKAGLIYWASVPEHYCC